MAADRAGPMVIIVMGVAGSGKTTVGRLLADALDAERSAVNACNATEALIEGMQAFMEKRPPRFSGR